MVSAVQRIKAFMKKPLYPDMQKSCLETFLIRLRNITAHAIFQCECMYWYFQLGKYIFTKHDMNVM